MSGKRYYHASVVLDGKIYAMGGYDGGTRDTVEVYDPQADSWQRVASMLRGLSDHAAAVMGGKIYVTGGEPNLGSPVNSVYVYDPQADAWTQLASMGIARRYHASAAVGGKLYVFGGRGGDDEYLSTAEVRLVTCAQLYGGSRSLSAVTARSLILYRRLLHHFALRAGAG